MHKPNTPASEQEWPKDVADRAKSAACEQAFRYPHAANSRPCRWPECDLDCKGREHRLSAYAAVQALRPPAGVDDGVAAISAHEWAEFYFTHAISEPGNKDTWAAIKSRFGKSLVANNIGERCYQFAHDVEKFLRSHHTAVTAAGVDTTLAVEEREWPKPVVDLARTVVNDIRNIVNYACHMSYDDRVKGEKVVLGAFAKYGQTVWTAQHLHDADVEADQIVKALQPLLAGVDTVGHTDVTVERRQFPSAPGTYGSDQNRRISDDLTIFLQDQYYHHTKNFSELADSVLDQFNVTRKAAG